MKFNDPLRVNVLIRVNVCIDPLRDNENPIRLTR